MTLSPCPFCGSADVEMDSYRALGWMGIQYEVKCTDCNASGPNADTEDDAVTEWNRRHDPKRHEDAGLDIETALGIDASGAHSHTFDLAERFALDCSSMGPVTASMECVFVVSPEWLAWQIGSPHITDAEGRSVTMTTEGVPGFTDGEHDFPIIKARAVQQGIELMCSVPLEADDAHR